MKLEFPDTKNTQREHTQHVHLIHLAKEQGEIDRGVDPYKLVFEIEAVLELTNVRYTLDRDPEIIERGRSIVEAAIQRSLPSA